MTPETFYVVQAKARCGDDQCIVILFSAHFQWSTVTLYHKEPYLRVSWNSIAMLWTQRSGLVVMLTIREWRCHGFTNCLSPGIAFSHCAGSEGSTGHVYTDGLVSCRVYTRVPPDKWFSQGTNDWLDDKTVLDIILPCANVVGRDMRKARVRERKKERGMAVDWYFGKRWPCPFLSISNTWTVRGVTDAGFILSTNEEVRIEDKITPTAKTTVVFLVWSSHVSLTWSENVNLRIHVCVCADARMIKISYVPHKYQLPVSEKDREKAKVFTLEDKKENNQYDLQTSCDGLTFLQLTEWFFFQICLVCFRWRHRLLDIFCQEDFRSWIFQNPHLCLKPWQFLAFEAARMWRQK